MTIVRLCSSEDTAEQTRLYHPCPNVTIFSHFSANVIIFINLQPFFSHKTIDNINFPLFHRFIFAGSVTNEMRNKILDFFPLGVLHFMAAFNKFPQ